MTSPKISKQEWPVMEALWRWGALPIREIHSGIRDANNRPAYTTVQTMVYRLEARGAVRRVEKIQNYHVFQAVVTREMAERQMVADYLKFFDGRVWPFLEHSIEMGRMKTSDLRDAQSFIDDLAKWGRG